MKLVIAGASGFIGSALCSRLLDKGHVLALLTRVEPRDASTATKRWLHWTPGTPGHWETGVDGADGVINLAGEPIAAKRWTERQKQKILTSRIDTTNSLVEAITKAKQRPGFLINASAVGYYGPRGDETVTEEAAAGNDFLSVVCREWEEEAKKAESLGVRVIRVRTGIVLGRGGGALAKMVPPFKFYVGGPLGSGMQWMSWIHLEDEVGLMLYLIEPSQATGPFNANAPNPVRRKEVYQARGQVRRHPACAPLPALRLRSA